MTRSEEDNDPLTDDAQSAVSVPIGSCSIAKLPGSHPPRSSHPKHPTATTRGAATKHHLAHNRLFSDSDGGVEGDIESSTTAGADALFSSHSIPHYHHHKNPTSLASTPSTPSAVPPSAVARPSNSNTCTNLPSSTHPFDLDLMLTSPARSAQPLTVTERKVQEPSVPTEAKEAFNPAALSAEDIQAFVAKAIQGEMHRTYRINPPPKDRPVRVYADGVHHFKFNYVTFLISSHMIGVYDLFHFGFVALHLTSSRKTIDLHTFRHSLQLRQAKLSFPSVYLLVGVISDDMVRRYKAQPVMTQAER